MSQWPMHASTTTTSKQQQQSLQIPRSHSQETLDADDFTTSELPPPSPVFDLDDFMIDPAGTSDYMNPTVSPKQLGDPWAPWDPTTTASMYQQTSENIYLSDSTPSSYLQSTSIMIPPGASALSSMAPLSPQHDSALSYKFPEPGINSPQSVLSSFFAQQQQPPPRHPIQSPYHRTQPAYYQPSSTIYSDYELATSGTGIDIEHVPEMYQMGKIDGQQYHGIGKLPHGDSLFAVSQQSIYSQDSMLQSAPQDGRASLRYNFIPRRDSSVPPYSLDNRHLRHKAVFPSSAPTLSSASDLGPLSPSGSPRSVRGASLARSSPPLVPESPKFLSPTSPTTQFTASPAQLSASPHQFAGTSPVFVPTAPVTFVDQTAQYSTSPQSDEASFVSSAGHTSFANESRLRKRRRLDDGSDGEDDSDEKRSDDIPTKSELRPPKQAPSMWQIYFADWLQEHKTRHPHDKLNVAQAAKEAGQLYKNLSSVEKESLKRRVQVEKDVRERRLAAWHRTLTPEDIKRENKFRAAQRKAGLSRRANIKDPNAPKKPLSAYFMFLAKIRSDQRLVDEVFGGESETTRQSVLAARRWREMSDEEKKPFLTQAEHDKIQYEALRKIYEGHASGSRRGFTPSSQMTGTGYIVPQQINFSEDITASILNARPIHTDSDDFKVVSYDPDATITARKSTTRSAPIPIFPSSTGTMRRRVVRKTTRHSGEGGIPRSLSGEDAYSIGRRGEGDSPVESSESDDDWVPGKSI